MRILQVGRAVGVPARLAHVTILIRGAAKRAGAAHETIGEEALILWAEELLEPALFEQPALFELAVDLVGVGLVDLTMRAVEAVEVNTEAGEVGDVLFVHLLDHDFRRDAELARSELDRRAVHIIAADVHRVTPRAVERAHVNVRLQILDEMPGGECCRSHTVARS